MVEKSDVVEECSSCVRLKQEIEIARKDQASTLKMIKEKIMSTDKLIKKYQKKCDDFDKQAKLLNDMTMKKENCERNAEVLQEQLNHSLEVTEPQKKTIKRLIQEKFVAEEKMQEMKQKNVDLEEVINHLRQELQLRDEKASSWKLEQQIQAKQIEKEKKRVEKLTKDLEKVKEEIKNGRALVREKNRELHAAARRCDNLDIQVKRMKDELSHGKMQGSYRYSSQTKSKLSAKEVTRARRERQSGKYCVEKNAELVSHSADKQDIASDERPSLTSILDEMTKLDFPPVLSPLRPSLSDQENLPESKDSSSESSSGDGFSSSSDSSSDGEGGGSIGDLEEILELKLKEKDFTCTDTGPEDGFGLNMENCNHLESDVSGEAVENDVQDNEIPTNDEQTINKESNKNVVPDNKETEYNNLEERQFEREIGSEGEKAVVFDDGGKKDKTSTILESNIISLSGLITTSVSETPLEVDVCDTTAKNMDTSSTFDSAANSEKPSLDISAVGVDKPEKIEDIDFKNNNLSLSSPKRNLKDNVLQEDQLENSTLNRNNVTSSERNEMMTACIDMNYSTEPLDGDDAVYDDAVYDDTNGRNNGVVHNTSRSMDRGEFLSGGIAKGSAHLDKPVNKDGLTAVLSDDDNITTSTSLSVADDDKISRSSKEKPFSETDTKCTEDKALLVVSNEFQCANDKFIETQLEAADSGKENAECIPLAKLKNYGGNDVQVKCNSSFNGDDIQAEGLPFIKDSLEESGKTPEKELIIEEYKHGEESVVTNEVNEEESGILENDIDNVSKANASSDTASNKVNPSVQQCLEKKHESGSQGVACEGALYYETPNARRRIAHQPKKKSETPNNNCSVNNSIKLSEEILPDNINKLKQTSTSTNFGDKLSDKSDLCEHDENRKTSLQIPKDVDNGPSINEEENEIVNQQARKTKRSTTERCNVDKQKRTRTEKKSKASESICEDTEKQLHSISLSEETCENDIQENNKLNSNTDALSCKCDDNLQDDQVKDSLSSPVNGEKSRVIEDYSMNCHLNSTDDDNTKLLSKCEAKEMEKICCEAVDNEVPAHKSSTNNFSKDKELQCCDDTSLDKCDTIMDKSTEEVIDEGETLVFDGAGTDTNTALVGQVLLDSTKDVTDNEETCLADEAGNDVNTVLLGQDFPDSTKDANDFVSPDRKLGAESKDSVTNLHLECPIEAQDSAIMDQVTSVEENCNMEKLEPEASDDGCKTALKKKKGVNCDGESDFNLINTNKPEQDKDKRNFTAIKEKFPNFKSDTPKLKCPNISIDSLSISSVIDDSLNLFDENVPLLSPLPSSPASSRESSPVHVFEFETEHSLSSVCTGVSSSLSSVPQPSCSTKKRVLENYGELERPDDCDEEDNSLNHKQIKEPSNKQTKKKRGTLSVRPLFLTEIKYAEKVLRFLCQERIKMDDVVARVSSPTNISNGTPLAAALVKFIHNEDLMPDIIQKYNDRDRQNDTHTSRLAHLTEWNPVLSVFETRVFEMVIRLSEVEHLRGLSTKITSLLNRSIIHSCSVTEEPIKKCVASKCRLLCILSRQESNLQRMRVLCYDIIRLLYSRPGTVLYLMISIAAVWPTVLSSLAAACTTPGGLVCLSGENYQPLPCTVQMILTTWVRSNDWVLLGNVIEWLCAWKHVPFRVFSIEQLVEELVRLMKDPSFAHLMPGKDGFPVLGFGLYEVVKALELVTCVLGWAWLNNTLIREIIWDILASWASRTQPIMGNTAAALPHQHMTDGQSDAGEGLQTPIDSLQTSGENKGDMDEMTERDQTSNDTGLSVNTEDTSNEKCETTEATIVAAIRLLGLVCRIAIQQHQTSIPQVMPLLVGILEGAQVCSVPYVVQLACAYSLLELSPWEPSQVYSVLEKWKLLQDKRNTLPKSLIQGLSSLNFSLHSGRNYSSLFKRSVNTEEEDEEHDDSESDPLEM